MTAVIQSGVNPAHYALYGFDTHIWRTGSTPRPELLELTDHCVQVGESYMIRLSTDSWAKVGSMASARRYLDSHIMGATLPSGTVVEPEMIATYLTGEKTVYLGDKPIKQRVGACPILQATTVLPLCPRFVTVDGSHGLNIWRDTMVRGEESDFDTACLMLLHLVHGSLCDQPDPVPGDPVASARELLAMIRRDEWRSDEFRYVMHWLAALHQRPGINLQTNLWFCGAVQGIGKGTLTGLMREVLGSEFTAALDQGEIERGWANLLRGKVLITCDEFDAQKKGGFEIDWNRWIKRNTCEAHVDFAERNVGNIKTLNIGNYLFMTNSTEPIKIDANDRRNAFIATSNDDKWRQVAAGMNTSFLERGRAKIARGWAWLLGEVRLDLKIAHRGLFNERKAEIIDAAMSSPQRWVLNDPVVTRDAALPAATLYERYQTWCDEQGEEEVSQTKWGIEMRRGVANGWAEKDKNGEGRMVYTLFTRKLGNTAAGDEIVRRFAAAAGVEAERVSTMPEKQAVERGKSNIVRLRDALMAKRAAERDRDLGIPQDAEVAA